MMKNLHRSSSKLEGWLQHCKILEPKTNKTSKFIKHFLIQQSQKQNPVALSELTFSPI